MGISPPSGGLGGRSFGRGVGGLIVGLGVEGQEKKMPRIKSRAHFLKSATTYSPTYAVPSALAGLTSLFGMGRGGTPSL